MAAVFVFHADVLGGGFIGVDVFFVISGFLITGLAIVEVEATGRLGLGAFWARRARRLLPALFLLVGTIVAVAAIAGARIQSLPRDVVATLAYVANWTRVRDDYDYFAAYEEPSVLEHTWSLAVEEQFYVIWPLVLVATIWLAARRRWKLRTTIAVTSIGLAVLSTAWSWRLAASDAALNRLYFGTDTRAVGLAVGCVAACVLTRVERTADRDSNPLVTALGATAIGVLAVLAIAIDGSERWLYGPGFALIALASVAVVRASCDRGPVARALSAGPLPAIGRVSYGIYLWHWPIIVVLDGDRTGLDGLALGALWVAATAAATAISWFLVERRAPMPLGRRPMVGLSYGMVGVMLALGATAAIDTSRPEIDPELLAGAELLPTDATPRVESTAPPSSPPTAPRSTAPSTTVPTTTPTADDLESADVEPVEPLDPGDPVDPGPSEPFDVLILGDSVAESLTAGPPEELAIDGRPVRVRNHGIIACPVDFDGRWVYDAAGPTDDPLACEGDARFDQVVTETEPELIVLLFGWPGTIAGRELPDGRILTACDGDHDRRWVDAHDAIADRYRTTAPVVAASVAPPQRFLDPGQADRPGCLNDALRTASLPVFDWGDWVCPGTDCTRAEALRRDPVHFATDPVVLDIVWRALLAHATEAAGLDSPGSIP